MNKMKVLVLLLSASVVAACGTKGDPAAGTDFRVNSIEVDSTDINTTCLDPNSGLRLFVKQSATVELGNEANDAERPIDVQLDSYEIDYTALDGGPALSAHVYPFEVSYLVPGNGTLEVGIEMVPIVTKKQYYNATTNTTNFSKISLYQAHYVFNGTTEFKEPVQAEGDITFALGNNYIVDCE